MGASQAETIKYVIHTRFEVEGIVEKPDVIGAIFGQTEGLFGPELELRELQRSGRIGRIEIDLESKKDQTKGTIQIPTSLDRVSTAIIAASLESINRVGPCLAKLTAEKIQDVRDARRRVIIDRSKKILRDWTIEAIPSTDEVYREVSEALRLARAVKYGPENLSAGPDVENSREILIVEGRADIINLLKNGIQNTIAVEGTKIPQTVIKLSREKIATAFLDGDRGGDLILKELLQVASIKSVARAPKGKEVEDLTPSEIAAALKKRVSIDKIPKDTGKKKRKRGKVLVPKQIVSSIEELKGTLEALLFNEKMKQLERLPVSELAEKLGEIEGVDAVVFDGVITQRLVDVADENKIKLLVAARVSDVVKQPLNVTTLAFTDIKN
jgi:DNA primase